MQLFLFRSDRRSFWLDFFSSPLLSPYRQPHIFRCKWSCSQIFYPANSSCILIKFSPGRTLENFSLGSPTWLPCVQVDDILFPCPESCYALVLIIYSLAAAERPPLASSPLGDKAVPTHQVSHLSSLVFRVECCRMNHLAGCCHLVVQHIDMCCLQLVHEVSYIFPRTALLLSIFKILVKKIK
jgi:hypothetical protein